MLCHTLPPYLPNGPALPYGIASPPYGACSSVLSHAAPTPPHTHPYLCLLLKLGGHRLSCNHSLAAQHRHLFTCDFAASATRLCEALQISEQRKRHSSVSSQRKKPEQEQRASLGSSCSIVFDKLCDSNTALHFTAHSSHLTLAGRCSRTCHCHALNTLRVASPTPPTPRSHLALASWRLCTSLGSSWEGQPCAMQRALNARKALCNHLTGTSGGVYIRGGRAGRCIQN